MKETKKDIRPVGDGGCWIFAWLFQPFLLTWDKELSTLHIVQCLFSSRHYQGHTIVGINRTLFKRLVDNGFPKSRTNPIVHTHRRSITSGMRRIDSDIVADTPMRWLMPSWDPILGDDSRDTIFFCDLFDSMENHWMISDNRGNREADSFIHNLQVSTTLP